MWLVFLCANDTAVFQSADLFLTKTMLGQDFVGVLTQNRRGSTGSHIGGGETHGDVHGAVTTHFWVLNAWEHAQFNGMRVLWYFV